MFRIIQLLILSALLIGTSAAKWTRTNGPCFSVHGDYKSVGTPGIGGRPPRKQCMELAVGLVKGSFVDPSEFKIIAWSVDLLLNRCFIYYVALGRKDELPKPPFLGPGGWPHSDFVGTGHGEPVNSPGAKKYPPACYSSQECFYSKTLPDCPPPPIIPIKPPPIVFQSAAPTAIPTYVPTAIPTYVPTAIPTYVPTAIPTFVPTTIPPTAVPVPTTIPPTAAPTAKPTAVPTVLPVSNVLTGVPTITPIGVTAIPTTLSTAIPLITDILTDVPTSNATIIPSPTRRIAKAFKIACGCNSETNEVSKIGNWYCSGYGVSRGICSSLVVPGDYCYKGSLKCPTKERRRQGFTWRRKTGDACKCYSYGSGATSDASVLCRHSDNRCELPSVEGGCDRSSSACASQRIVRLLAAVSLDTDTLQTKLAEACNTTVSQIKIYSRCPVKACPRSICPSTLNHRRSLGCLIANRFRNAMTAGAEEIYIDFDILENDDVVRNEKIIQLYANVDEIRTSGAIDASDPQLVALKDLEVNAVSTELPPVEKTMPPVEDESSLLSQYWWAIVLGSMILITAGIIIRKRVTFSDATDFKASQPEEKPLPRGMEGCHRAHRGLRRQPRRGGRIAGLNSDEQEICIDMPELSSEYQAYPSMPYVARSHGRGSKCSVRSRSASSSGSSEPEMSI